MGDSLPVAAGRASTACSGDINMGDSEGVEQADQSAAIQLTHFACGLPLQTSSCSAC